MLRRVVFVTCVVLALVAPFDVADAGDGRRPAPIRPRVDRRPPIVVAVATPRPLVALTFDDGPDPRWTPRVLDELRRAGARATFFVTGDHARAHPELLRAITDAGSEVANHTDTHPHLDRLDAAAVAAEVERAAHAIGAAGVGQAPYFRPPRGRYGGAAMQAVDAAGLLSVGWTVCLERRVRTLGVGIGPIAAAHDVRPGGILLAHDGGIPDRRTTVEALPALLDTLAERGYEIVTVSDLLGAGAPLRGRPGLDPRDAVLTRVGPGRPR